ncbi:hypothetical protein DYH09_11440 [bacterium CPR1]|nr:hypothetical protein [bacterium CPR1]
MELRDSRLPYQQRALERRLAAAPRVVLSTADTYVSAAALSTSGVLPLPGELWRPTAEVAHGPLRLASGALALAHGISGVQTLMSAPYREDTRARNLRRLQGIGDLVAAAGLAGQAFGLGPWTAALAVAGSLTATTTSCLRGRMR